MVIRGLQKLTLLDFPGKLAATVFLGGCNFRCPFCHNASLVLTGEGERISEEEFFAFLEKRRGMLEGVCVSGGEPTLQKEIFSFIERIKAQGYLVKLDTNGYEPEILERLLSRRLVDYVAMDIKNSQHAYAKTAGIPDLDIEKIKRSAALLMNGDIPFEFRTTVVKELHGEENIREIGEWLRGEKKFYLQAFRDSGDIIAAGMSAHTEETMTALLGVLREYIPNAEMR